MARGLMKGRPSPEVMRDRIALVGRVGLSAREMFELRVEPLRARRASEARALVDGGARS